MDALLTYITNNLNHYGLTNFYSAVQQVREQTRDEAQQNSEQHVVQQNEENLEDGNYY